MTGRTHRYSAILFCSVMGFSIAFLWIFALTGKPTQAAVNVASLNLNKTVGTDASVCAVTDSIEAEPGTAVTYCYEVTNTGTDILITHNLVDDQLGTILVNFPHNLNPGNSAFLTQTVVVTGSVTNIATWNAQTNGGVVASDDDSAQVVVLPPQLEMVKTVGLDATQCAATDSIEIPAGTAVTYCYTVRNTGNWALVAHNLIDDQLGTILTNFPYNLMPGASAFLTMTIVVTDSVTNVATWSARGGGGAVASDDDLAQVVVVPPSLELVKTVGLNASVCASTDQVEVAPGTPVTYCYEVTNTGIEALDQHTLVDDQLGTILMNFPYNLMPGASAFLTQTVVVSDSITNIATWSAETDDGIAVSDEDTAQVVVIPPAIELVKTVGLDASVCAATDQVDIPAGTKVTYCYSVRNTGITSLETHYLVDDQLGVILSNFPYSLMPGASTFLTQTVTISNTVINEATWRGITAGGFEAIGFDTAQVNVEGDGLFDLFLPAINR